MDEFQILLNKSFRFLSYRPRSEKEVRDYLIKQFKRQRSKVKIEIQNEKIIGETIDSIISKLKEHKFLDDKDFTKWWIEHRSKKGIKFIIFELKQKGIDKDIMDEVLQSPDLENKSDFDKALGLAQKRIGKYKNLDRRKVYEKLGRFLASKGFDFDIIKKVIDQVLTK